MVTDGCCRRESLASRAGKRYQTYMQILMVMTLIGPDRKGLGESVACAVADPGSNWLENRMCRLVGEFAGILGIEIPEDKKSRLLAALQKIAELNVVVPTDPKLASANKGRQTKLEIVGNDRPGIVRKITSALARAGVNVQEFYSEVVSVPMSDETLFKSAARLQLPKGCVPATPMKDLEKIAGDLLVDVSFAELSGNV